VTQDDDLKLPLITATGEEANNYAQEPEQHTHQHDAQSEAPRPRIHPHPRHGRIEFLYPTREQLRALLFQRQRPASSTE
jgi:hypothetical protein